MRSLNKCALAKKTNCFIAVDYPPEPKMLPDYNAILKFNRKKWKFKKTTIFTQKRNLGPVKNYETAISKIFRTHSRVIVLEDDNIVSKNFLVFMNEALRHFEKVPKCLGVCGHTLSQKSGRLAHDVYRAFYFCGWGCGMFRSRNENYQEAQAVHLNRCFLNLKKLFLCLKNHPHVFRIYMESRLRGTSFGDINLSVAALAGDYFYVYPSQTKVVNLGHDGSGHRIREKKDPFPRKFLDENKTRFDFTMNPAWCRSYHQANRAKLGQYIKIRFFLLGKLYFHYLRQCLKKS